MKKGIFALIAVLLPMLSVAQEDMGLDQKIDQAFKPVSDFISGVIFFEVFDGAPFVIILLVISREVLIIYIVLL